MKTIQEAVNQRLDKNYAEAAGSLLKAVYALTNAPASPLQVSLKELDDRAKELHEKGEKFKRGDPIISKLEQEYTNALQTTNQLITANSEIIELSGSDPAADFMKASIVASATTAKLAKKEAELILKSTAILDPLSPAAIKQYDQFLSIVGIAYKNPAANSALYRGVAYATSKDFVAGLEKWGHGYSSLFAEKVTKAFNEGWSPIRTASEFRSVAQSVPRAAAENLTRTLQLIAYRDAVNAQEIANSGLLEYKIRIAKLDERTCLGCVALHGTKLKIGERVDDHWRGRCGEWVKVIGGADYPEYMQADSVPGKRNFVPYQTGEDWFAGLPEERQILQNSFRTVSRSAGNAKFRAYQDGVPLSDFVVEWEDKTFGTMVGENSLIGSVGEEKAKEYYLVNQDQK